MTNQINLDEYVVIRLDTFRRKRVIPVTPACKVDIPAPVALYGGSPDSILNSQLTSVSLPALGCARFRNARVHRPGLAVSQDEKIIFSYAQFPQALIRNHWEKKHNALICPDDLEELPHKPIVCLSRPGDHIFGHWLVDILPRVWWLEQHRPGKAYYLIPHDTADYAKELLDRLGVPAARWIYWEESTLGYRIKDLWIPSNFRYLQVCHPRLKTFATELASTYGISLPGKSPSGGPKWWISRKNWSKRKKSHRNLVNVDEVEECFTQNGYECISPETLPLSEQIQLMSEASALAGEDGSGMHLNLFAPDQTPVISVRSQYNQSMIQLTLCAIKQQPIGYVLGTSKHQTTRNRSGDYHIHLSDVERVLQPSTFAASHPSAGKSSSDHVSESG